MAGERTLPAETWRLFIAIPLPEPVKDQLEKAQEELRRGATGEGIRWTARGQWHLTLKFLGAVEAGRVQVLKDSLDRACATQPSLPLRAAGIGFFPPRGLPRVVWAGVSDAQGRLAQLQGAVESAARDFTQEPPEGRFIGHVTLARARVLERPEAARLAALAESMSARCFGEWTAGHVELVRSDLEASGARHATLASVPLA